MFKQKYHKRKLLPSQMTDRRKSTRRKSEIEEFIKKQSELNDKITLALFGNENENGIVKDVKEMRQIFDDVKGAKKVSIALLKGLILLGGAIGAVYVIIGRQH